MTARIVLTNVQSGIKVADLQPISWSVKRRISTTGSFTFNIPMIVPRANELENYCEAEVIIDGIPLISGRIDQVKRTVSDDKLAYSVSGLGEAELLARYMAKDTSHYQDVLVVLILADLLSYGGWDIGSTSTMLNNSVSTTIDLRNEEHLLPQIQAVCDSIPGLFWRYGGLNGSGKHTLDFGYFDEETQIQYAQPHIISMGNTFGSIESITLVENHANLVYEINALGGTYEIDGAEEGIQGVVNLEDSAAANVIPEPGFPIMVGDSGQTVIRNNSLYPVGGTVRKQFDVHVPENGTPPTQAEIDQATQALYLRGVRYLQEHAYSDSEYDAVIAGINIARLPDVGQRVYVNANQVHVLYNGLQSTILSGFRLNNNLRVGEWDCSGNKDSVKFSLKLTEHEYLSPLSQDPLMQLWDVLEERIPKQGIYGALNTGTRNRQYTTYTTVPTGTATDCVSSGVNGKSVIISFPASDPWVSELSLIDLTVSPGYVFEITTVPDWPLTELEICVTREDAVNWSAVDTVTGYATWLGLE